MFYFFKIVAAVQQQLQQHSWNLHISPAPPLQPINVSRCFFGCWVMSLPFSAAWMFHPPPMAMLHRQLLICCCFLPFAFDCCFCSFFPVTQFPPSGLINTRFFFTGMPHRVDCCFCCFILLLLDPFLVFQMCAM